MEAVRHGLFTRTAGLPYAVPGTVVLTSSSVGISSRLPTEGYPMRIEPAVGAVRAEAEDRGFVLAAVGELDELGVRPLQRAVPDALRRDRPAHITVDLSAVTFVDAAGVNTLITTREDAAQLGCRLLLVNPRPPVRRALRIVGLLNGFGVGASGSSARQPRHPDGAGPPGGRRLITA